MDTTNSWSTLSPSEVCSVQTDLDQGRPLMLELCSRALAMASPRPSRCPAKSIGPCRLSLLISMVMSTTRFIKCRNLINLPWLFTSKKLIDSTRITSKKTWLVSIAMLISTSTVNSIFKCPTSRQITSLSSSRLFQMSSSQWLIQPGNLRNSLESGDTQVAFQIGSCEYSEGNRGWNSSMEAGINQRSLKYEKKLSSIY